MKANPSTKPPTKGVLLNSTEEKILSMANTYRFVGALDVANLLFSPASLTYARTRLSKLAAAKYLYRFRLPSVKTGGTELIYTLGSRGRDFIAEELGLPVDWYFRPGKLKRLSHSHAQHNLLLTRFCVASQSFCRSETRWRLVTMRLCYELARVQATDEEACEGATKKLKVVPDAWLCFERLKEGEHEHFIPLLLEIDRGMEYQQKFKRHVYSRIEFIRSGEYKKLFGTGAVVIAYATTGETPEYRDTRRRAMCTWTQEVLADLHMENWSAIFRISSLQFDELYSTPIFSEPLWYKPDSLSPIPLFAS